MRSTSSRSRRATRSSSGSSSISDASAFPISFSDSSWRRPAGRRLVQARVLDRDRRLGGEQAGQLLVLVREVRAARLLGQVEVAVGDAAEHDRHAEERPHRRVVAGKADRARVAPRCRAAGAAALRGSARRGCPRPRGRSPIALVGLARRFPSSGTAREPCPGRVDHAERGVARARSAPRRASTMRCRSASSDSSDVSAIPASTSRRSRSGFGVGAAPRSSGVSMCRF